MNDKQKTDGEIAIVSGFCKFQSGRVCPMGQSEDSVSED